jgi:hypothetical protein
MLKAEDSPQTYTLLNQIEVDDSKSAMRHEEL